MKMSIRETGLFNLTEWAEHAGMIFTHSRDKDGGIHKELPEVRKEFVANRLLMMLGDQSTLKPLDFFRIHQEFSVGDGEKLINAVLSNQGEGVRIETIASQLTIPKIQRAIRDGLEKYGLTEEVLRGAVTV